MSTLVPPGARRQPLHLILDHLDQFLEGLWQFQHADSTRYAEMPRVWCELTAPFLKKYTYADEAFHALADPALAWLKKQGFSDLTSIETVKRATRFVVELPRLLPFAQPEVYDKPENASVLWMQQGEYIEQARKAMRDLRELVALTGEDWSRSDAKQSATSNTTCPAADTSVSDASGDASTGSHSTLPRETTHAPALARQRKKERRHKAIAMAIREGKRTPDEIQAFVFNIDSSLVYNGGNKIDPKLMMDRFKKDPKYAAEANQLQSI
jgi:hypothetical protein